MDRSNLLAVAQRSVSCASSLSRVHAIVLSATRNTGTEFNEPTLHTHLWRLTRLFYANAPAKKDSRFSQNKTFGDRSTKQGFRSSSTERMPRGASGATQGRWHLMNQNSTGATLDSKIPYSNTRRVNKKNENFSTQGARKDSLQRVENLSKTNDVGVSEVKPLGNVTWADLEGEKNKLSTAQKIRFHSQSMIKVCKEFPSITATEVQVHFALCLLRNFRSLSAKTVSSQLIKDLINCLYCYAFLGLSSDNLPNWITWALLHGVGYLDVRDYTRLCFALSHYGLSKELASLSVQALRLSHQFTSEQSSTILQTFAECRLLHSSTTITKALIHSSILSKSLTQRLFYVSEASRSGHELVELILNNRNASSCTPLLRAALAITSLPWNIAKENPSCLQSTSCATEKAAFAAAKSILKNSAISLSYAPREYIDTLLIFLNSKSDICLVSLQGMITLCLTKGYFNDADHDSMRSLVHGLLNKKMYETVLALVQTLNNQDRRIDAVSCILSQMHLNESTIHELKLTKSHALDEEFLAKIISSLGGLCCFLKSSLGTKLVVFYTKLRNLDGINAVIRKLSNLLNAQLNVSPKRSFLMNDSECTNIVRVCHLLYCCADVPRESQRDIARLARVLMPNILWHSNTLLLVKFAVRILQDQDYSQHTHITQNMKIAIANKISPHDCLYLFQVFIKIVTPNKDILKALLEKIPIAVVAQTVPLNPFASNLYIDVLKDRRSEMTFRVIWPLLSDRSNYRLVSFQSLSQFVWAATHNDKKTAAVVLEVILAFGRRDAYDFEWISQHAHCLVYLRTKNMKDVAHMVYLLSRSETGVEILGTLMKVIEPFVIQCIRSKSLDASEIPFLIRGVFLQAKWKSENIRKEIDNAYFSTRGLLKSDSTIQTAYAYTVLGYPSIKCIKQLSSLILTNGFAESISWIVSIAKQFSITLDRDLQDACISRLREIEINPVQLARILNSWESLNSEKDLDFAEFSSSLVCCTSFEEYSASTLTNLIVQLVRHSYDAREEVKIHLIKIFHQISLNEENIGSVVLCLSRIGADLSNTTQKTVRILKTGSHLSSQQLGYLLKAYTKGEEMSCRVVEAILPHMHRLLPSMNSMEFTQFCLPMFRYENLPYEVGELLCGSMKKKLPLLSSAQATRMCAAVGQPYFHDANLLHDLKQKVFPGVQILKLQELVVFMANECMNHSPDEMLLLRKCFHRLLKEGTAMDCNWSLQTLSKAPRRVGISQILWILRDLAPRLNGYEVTTLLSTLAACGICESTEVWQPLVDRLRTISGTSWKGNHLLTLMNTMLRYQEKIQQPLHNIIKVLLEKCVINGSFLVQIIDFCHRWAALLQPHTVMLIGEYALSFAKGSHPRKDIVLSLCAASKLPGLDLGNMKNQLTYLCSALQGEDMATVLLYHPCAAQYLPLRDVQCTTLPWQDMNTLASIVNATCSTFDDNDEAHMSLSRKEILHHMETLINESMSSSSPEGEQETRYAITPTSATMIVRAYDGADLPKLLRITKLILTRGRTIMFRVPSSLCLEALRSVTQLQKSSFAETYQMLDTVVPNLTHRTLEALDTFSFATLTDLLSTLQALDIDDEEAVVKVLRRILECKDAVLNYPEKLPSLLASIEYFGPHLARRTYTTLQRLHAIPQLF